MLECCKHCGGSTDQKIYCPSCDDVETQLTAMTQRTEAAESANAALRDERDAWMAHAERQKLIMEAAYSQFGECYHAGNYEPAWHYMKELREVLDETAPISLAKRDARVKAEAMREAAEMLRDIDDPYEESHYTYTTCIELLEGRADEMEGSIGSDTDA